MPTHRLAALALALALPVAALAQTPTFTVVDTTNLNATLGNAGKGLFDPQVSGFTGVAYGANLFVAVAASGNETVIRWATSPDGITWTARSQPVAGGTTATQTSRVHFLNGKFIYFIGCDNGTWCYASGDGLTWTGSQVSTARINVEEFDTNGTLYVVAAHNGAQYTSNNLTTWTPAPVVPNGAGYDHLDLTYGAGKFFSTINGFGGATYASADGATWTAVPGLATVGGGRAEAGNGIVLFNIGSDRYKTSDGATFTKFTPTVPTGWIAPGGVPRFAGGRFLATAFDLNTGKEAYMGSSDGQAWTPFAYFPLAPAQPAGQSRLFFHTDIAFGAGKYVIAGQDISQTLTTKTTLPLILAIDAPAAPTPPIVTAQPNAANAVLGGSASFSVIASGSGNTYQWRKNGTAINGATAATLTLNNITAADAASYSVVVTNAAGSVTSNAATLTLVSANAIDRIINLSILTAINAPGEEFTMGYVVGGAGTSGAKPLVIRAAGPSLGALGVPATLADPKIELYAGNTKTGENNDWGGGTELAAALSAVGAFPYTGATSKDAAATASITTRDNSVKVSANGAGTGTVIAEVYDATPSSSFTAATPRLLNVSVLKNIGSKLTVGFVIGGETAKTVLIRAVGPGLSALGVNSGFVPDPQLTLFGAAAAKIGENNDWGGTAALTAAASAVGAFTIPAASKDAALLATLPPGNYSVEVTGAGGVSGLAVVEVYDVP
jgi:hypothetical protein